MRFPVRTILIASALTAASEVALAGGLWTAKHIENEARWAVASALPEGTDHAVHFHEIRAYRHADVMGAASILVCGTLEFIEEELGRVHFAVSYGRDARGRLARVGEPFFHGSNWLRGSVVPADLCAAADEAAGRGKAPALAKAERQ